MNGEQGRNYCVKCKHHRRRAELKLFSGEEMASAAVLKQQLEWVQLQRQREEAEQRRFMEGGVFDYEPFTYAWCAYFTEIDNAKKASAGDESLLTDLLDRGVVNVNPVTGEITPIYALCNRHNPQAECKRYEPR